MHGRIYFGRDFLHLARKLQAQASETRTPDAVSDAVAKLFLVQWGFSMDEVNEADRLFREKINAQTLEDFSIVLQRIVGYFSEDRPAREQLVIQLAAIVSLDFKVTDDEAALMRWFLEAFDLRPSEYRALRQRGWDLARALDFFGQQYLEAHRGE